MSHTPTSTAPQGTAPTVNAKPVLAGTRIRQRKGQAQAAAKFEPEVFRDSLLLHLSLVSTPPTVDALVAKLVSAGSTLEFLKYYEQLFELLFVGGLLQPGGSYLDEKRSPIYLLQDDAGWDAVAGIVESIKRVMQRYKYLQKPLEENFLPDLLGYLGKWDSAQRDKLAHATALLILDVGINARCLTSLTKDHVVKDHVALQFFTSFAKTYFNQKQTVEQLGATLRRAGVKDLLLLMPIQTRDRKHLEEHFKAEGLPQVNEWYGKIAKQETRERTIADLERMLGEDEANEQIIEQLKTQQTEKGVVDADLTEWIWQALIKWVDTASKGPQFDVTVIQAIKARAQILEAFCKGAKAQVGLINAVQILCYEDTRLTKPFPSILKELYNADVVSDQAIIYWHQKGAKPQGKQHFLKATEAMVKFLEEDEEEEDE